MLVLSSRERKIRSVSWSGQGNMFSVDFGARRHHGTVA